MVYDMTYLSLNLCIVVLTGLNLFKLEKFYRIVIRIKKCSVLKVQDELE